jgi:hypothetical protein
VVVFAEPRRVDEQEKHEVAQADVVRAERFEHAAEASFVFGSVFAERDYLAAGAAGPIENGRAGVIADVAERFADDSLTWLDVLDEVEPHVLAYAIFDVSLNLPLGVERLGEHDGKRGQVQSRISHLNRAPAPLGKRAHDGLDAA